MKWWGPRLLSEAKAPSGQHERGDCRGVWEVDSVFLAQRPSHISHPRLQQSFPGEIHPGVKGSAPDLSLKAASGRCQSTAAFSSPAQPPATPTRLGQGRVPAYSQILQFPLGNKMTGEHHITYKEQSVSGTVGHLVFISSMVL